MDVVLVSRSTGDSFGGMETNDLFVSCRWAILDTPLGWQIVVSQLSASTFYSEWVVWAS